MSTILGSITINDVSICEITGNPINTGLDLPTGSLALNTDDGRIYSKTGDGQFDWTETGTGSGQAPSTDIAFVFDGSLTVRANSSFLTSAPGLGIRVKKFSTRVLDITGSFTVGLNGRCVIGADSSASVRSI